MTGRSDKGWDGGCMLQVVSKCEAGHDQTGASIVASIFLSVFVALILGDAILTALALHKALNKDEREAELARRIRVLRDELKKVQDTFSAATKQAAQRQAVTLVPITISNNR